MKKILQLLLITLSTFFVSSCEENNPSIAEIIFNDDVDFAPTITTEGEVRIVNFTSTVPWNVSVESNSGEIANSWCTVSPTSGIAGESKLTITVNANDTYDNRESLVVFFINGEKARIITVKQLQTDDLTVPPEMVSVSPEGETFDVTVTANIEFSVDIQADWITEVKTKSLIDTKLSFVAKLNPTTTRRTGKIVITSSVGEKTITVEQDVINTNISDINFKAYVLDNFDTNNDEVISYKEAQAVTEINIGGLGSTVNSDNIESLQGVELFINLEKLYCIGSVKGKLATLDISKNIALKELNCSNNVLTTLDISENTALTELDFSNNKLTTINLSANTDLVKINCKSTDLTTLDILTNTELIELDCKDNPSLESVIVWKGFEEANFPQFNKDNHTVYKVNVFPDAVFKKYVLENFDSNNDGEISKTEANAVKTINTTNLKIKSLLGIEFFVNLNKLEYNGSGDYKLTTLDISENTILTELNCAFNKLEVLDVSNNTNLRKLICHSNMLVTIDVSNSINLTDLSCSDNRLTTINISSNINLINLSCNRNQLAALDLPKSIVMTDLSCINNQLTTIDISKNTELLIFNCFNNPNLTTIWIWQGYEVSNYFKKDDSANYVEKNTK